VAKVVEHLPGPEFKPQDCQKKKKKRLQTSTKHKTQKLIINESKDLFPRLVEWLKW
jgi:hypothetical protein